MCQKGSLPKLNDSENTTYQNLWDPVIAVLRMKCIALNAYIIKEDKSQIDNLSFLQKLENEQQNESKASRRRNNKDKKSMKLKAEKLIENVNEAKS